MSSLFSSDFYINVLFVETMLNELIVEENRSLLRERARETDPYRLALDQKQLIQERVIINYFNGLEGPKGSRHLGRTRSVRR